MPWGTCLWKSPFVSQMEISAKRCGASVKTLVLGIGNPILGDDGVPLDYHVRYWKSELIDFIILQQDAFDQVDASTSIERQRYMLEKLLRICDMDLAFDTFEEVNPFFKRVINVLKQMNYSAFRETEFTDFESELETILLERKN